MSKDVSLLGQSVDVPRIADLLPNMKKKLDTKQGASIKFQSNKKLIARSLRPFDESRILGHSEDRSKIVVSDSN